MATIRPTLTVYTLSEYQQRMSQFAAYASHIHLDIMDGVFAPVRSVQLDDIDWPNSMTVDIHLMAQQVEGYIDRLLQLRPQLVIVHAESQPEPYEALATLRSHGIKVGLAVLQNTSIDSIAPFVDQLDHVLIFSGNLGHHGGVADMALLDKVTRLRDLRPQLEIGWDGGISLENAAYLAQHGIDVLNVGGAISQADDPAACYERFVKTIR